MDHLALKETWVLKESLDLLVNKETPDHMVCLVLKAPSVHLERKVPQGNRVSMDSLELMGLLVIQEKRVLPGTKEQLASRVPRGPLVIPGLEV